MSQQIWWGFFAANVIMLVCNVVESVRLRSDREEWNKRLALAAARLAEARAQLGATNMEKDETK